MDREIAQKMFLMVGNLTAINIAARHKDEHPYTVARHFPLDSDEYVVALLHDSLEDGYATEIELREHFAPHIVEAVKVLTRHKDGTTYMDYIRRVYAYGGTALKVKIADATVNMKRCKADGNKKKEKRYIQALEIMTDGTEEATT